MVPVSKPKFGPELFRNRRGHQKFEDQRLCRTRTTHKSRFWVWGRAQKEPFFEDRTLFTRRKKKFFDFILARHSGTAHNGVCSTWAWNLDDTNLKLVSRRGKVMTVGAGFRVIATTQSLQLNTIFGSQQRPVEGSSSVTSLLVNRTKNKISALIARNGYKSVYKTIYR